MNTLPHQDLEPVRVIRESGKGRAVLIIGEKGAPYSTFMEGMFIALAEKARVVEVQIDSVTPKNWQLLTTSLISLMSAHSVRQAHMIACGAAASLIQGVALRDLKLLRTAVLIDATTRPHPSRRDRIIDRLEHALPLGLPFRSGIEGFDSKPYLQRIRCPVLVVTTHHATPFLKSEAEVLATGLPTAWIASLPEQNSEQELAALVAEFQEVPAKSPQKGR